MISLVILTAAGLALNCALLWKMPALALVSGALFAGGIWTAR